MLRTFAKSLLVGAVQKRSGIAPAGTIATALLTTGASLALTRGRRPVGLALAALGGLLLWREVERGAVSPTPVGDDGAAATVQR
jgi:uncharacterized membrane protein (UPF0136 family)